MRVTSDLDTVQPVIGRDDPCFTTFDGFEQEQQERHVSVKVEYKTKRVLTSRVRFFPVLATKCGSVRLSALVCHFAGWIAAKRRKGQPATDYDPCAKFGEAIGIGPKQVYRLLRQAKELGILDYKHIYQRTLVWFTDKTWSDVGACAYYDKDIADQLGINGAMLLATITNWTAYPSEDHPEIPGFIASPAAFVKKFPWMTVKAVRRALERLRDARWITWDAEGCNFGCKRYVALALKKPLREDERAADILRRTLKLPITEVPAAPVVVQKAPAQDRRTYSPLSAPTLGKRRCIPVAVSDADDL